MADDNDVPMELAIKNVEDELLEHIILPRVLPQEKSRKLYDTEMSLMNKMVENVETMAHVIPAKTVELFQRLHSVHMDRTKENVSRHINNLHPGDTFAMFVRFQHTALMIYVPPNENDVDDVKNVIVSTITNLHPDEIYNDKPGIDFMVILANLIWKKFLEYLKLLKYLNFFYYSSIIQSKQFKWNFRKC